MSSPPYSLAKLSTFDSDLTSLLQRHVPTGFRGRRMRRNFATAVDAALSHAQQQPRHPHEEPWPAEPLAGLELRKIRFYHHPFVGDAKLVRIPILVSHTHRAIVALCIYTHAEYTGRPPDKDLADVLDSLGNEWIATNDIPALIRKIAGE